MQSVSFENLLTFPVAAAVVLAALSAVGHAQNQLRSSHAVTLKTHLKWKPGYADLRSSASRFLQYSMSSEVGKQALYNHVLRGKFKFCKLIELGKSTEELPSQETTNMIVRVNFKSPVPDREIFNIFQQIEKAGAIDQIAAGRIRLVTVEGLDPANVSSLAQKAPVLNADRTKLSIRKILRGKPPLPTVTSAATTIAPTIASTLIASSAAASISVSENELRQDESSGEIAPPSPADSSQAGDDAAAISSESGLENVEVQKEQPASFAAEAVASAGNELTEQTKDAAVGAAAELQTAATESQTAAPKRKAKKPRSTVTAVLAVKAKSKPNPRSAIHALVSSMSSAATTAKAEKGEQRPRKRAGAMSPKQNTGVAATTSPIGSPKQKNGAAATARKAKAPAKPEKQATAAAAAP